LAGELLYAVPVLEVFMRRPAVACSLLTLAVGLSTGCPDRSIDEVFGEVQDVLEAAAAS